MAEIADRFTPLRPLGPYLLLVQDHDGMPLVLKRLADEKLQDPEARHEFRLEAWRVAQLRGPRLVRLYTNGAHTEERPFYTMGYAEGPPATLVQPHEAATCVRQLLEALSAIHRHGWVHAALEPAQLRRTESGVVLVGYGGLTPMGQVARKPGTVGYRSPEQEAGLPLDGRADLYSVGALIHFWLTGEMPGELDLLDLVADPLASLGRRLLSRQPNNRLPDAQTALAELDRQAGQAPRLTNKAPVLQPGTLPRVAALAPLERVFADLSRPECVVRRLEAPPGWGKTTLLSLAQALAKRNKLPVLRLRGAGPYAWPLTPWREGLNALISLAQERQSSILERCRLRLAPLMAPPPDARPSSPGVVPASDDSLASDALWRRISGALSELLSAVAAPGLVILLDDWDEADEASQRMLETLVRHLNQLPILFLVAGTPGRLKSGPWLSLDLAPFSGDELLQLARAMLPAPPAREGDLATLAAAAAGQPWFIRTLIGLWRDAGEIRLTGGQCEVPPPSDWPETVSALAWRRGSALDGHAWTVGGAAAILTPQISATALEAIVPDNEVLATGLDALLRAGILYRLPGGYGFTHPDFATMYTRALPPERQVALHNALVDAFLNQRLALHPLSAAIYSLRAERPEVAASLTLEAARHLLTLGAHETARAMLDEGLVTLDAMHPLRGSFMATLGEAHRRAEDLPAALTCLREARNRVSTAERVNISLALAEVLSQLQKHEEALIAWKTAAAEAENQGNVSALTQSLAGLTTTAHALGKYEEAVSQGEAALGAAVDTEPLPRALALLALGAVLAGGPRERQGEGVALLQQASALLETEGDRHRLARALLELTDAEMARGEVQFARNTVTRALTLAEDLHEPLATVQAGIQAAQVFQSLGDLPRARELASEARRRAEANQLAVEAAEAQGLEGLLRALLKDTEAGLALNTEALRRMPENAPPAAFARLWLTHIETLLHLSLYPEAANALQSCATITKASGRVDLAGRRTYWMGVWAARTGDRERARQELRAVLAQPNQYLVAQAGLRLGQLAADAGARSEAAGWLEQARRTALALGADKLAIEVERAERSLQGLPDALEDSPAAAAGRLEALLGEALKLLPKVLSPAQHLAELETRLKEAHTLNTLWPALYVAKTEEEVAHQLAEAVFTVTPGVTRILILDQALAPYSARARGAGTIPFDAELIDAELCSTAMSERDIRTAQAGSVIVPLTEGPTAPVWGAMVLLGENLEPREILLKVAAAGALVLSRLED